MMSRCKGRYLNHTWYLSEISPAVICSLLDLQICVYVLGYEFERVMLYMVLVVVLVA